MKKMDKKREEIIKAKFEKILEDKMRREEKVKELQKRQAEAEKEDYEASKDIIAYQIESMNRSMNNQLNKRKRANTSGEAYLPFSEHSLPLSKRAPAGHRGDNLRWTRHAA